MTLSASHANILWIKATTAGFKYGFSIASVWGYALFSEAANGVLSKFDGGQALVIKIDYFFDCSRTDRELQILE